MIAEFARQAGIQIFVPSARLRGVRLPAVTGQLDVRDALRALLAGSGVEIASDNGRTITLRERPSAPRSPAPSPVRNTQEAPPSRAASAPMQRTPAMDEILVTGSRVVRDGYEAPTPVTVLAVDQLNAMADTNIADAVTKLPMFSGSEKPRTSTQNLTSGASGVNTLNLRGMGANRTLVLLDGKRVINASLANNYVGADINTVPNGLVSRVDVVTGGASAAYGSDALSGVVNFVLDHEFVGVRGAFEGGVTGYGDDRSYLASVSAGFLFGGGRGHLLMFGEDGFNAGIHGNTRPWNGGGGAVFTNPAYAPSNGQPFYLVGDHIGVSNGTPGGIITSGPLKGIYFGPGGTPAQFNYGLVSTSNIMQGGDWRVSRLDDGLDIDPALARQNMFTRVSYDVTDNLKVYAEYQWSNAHANANSNPNRTLDNVPILPGNPFIPAAVQAQMTALKLTQITIGTTNADLPRFHSNNIRTLRRGDFGMTGDFEAAGAVWRWEAYYQVSAEGLAERTDNDGNLPRLAQAWDAVRGPNGAIVCRSSLANPNNGCVPYNVFGIGVNSAAAVQYVVGTSFRHDSLRQDTASITVNGQPFETWAGPVSLAAGIEHRYERARSIETADDDANNWLTGNYHRNFGNYSVTEGFLETVVPLADNAAWAKSFEVNAAIRATNYTTSGSVATWKLGATWQPTDALRFRATRSRDIRAPYLGELFSDGTAHSGATFFDPTNNSTTTNGFVLTRGNPTLGPEEADGTGIGAVLLPSFFPGFETSVDYYNIDIRNATEVPSAQSVITGCYGGLTSLCENIVRVNGVINTVVTPPSNIAQQIEKGLDIEMSYSLPLGSIVETWNGSLDLRVLATYILELKSIDLQFGTVDGRGVVGAFGGAGQSGLTAPKFKTQVSLTYDNDPVMVGLSMRHVASGVYNNAFTACYSACPAGALTISNNHIGANTLFDLALRYRPLAGETNAEVYLTVQNLLNQAPPFIGGPVGGAYYAGQFNGTYDRLGRAFLTGVRFKM